MLFKTKKKIVGGRFKKKRWLNSFQMPNACNNSWIIWAIQWTMVRCPALEHTSYKAMMQRGKLQIKRDNWNAMFQSLKQPLTSTGEKSWPEKNPMTIKNSLTCKPTFPFHIKPKSFKHKSRNQNKTTLTCPGKPKKDTCSSTPPPCFPGVNCMETADGVRCGPCPRGFIGNGRTCRPGITCADRPCFPGILFSL